MSNSWIKVDAEDTFEVRTIVTYDNEIEEQKYNFDRCLVCFGTEVDLYGLSHTGGFRGVCKHCLKEINDVKEVEDD